MDFDAKGFPEDIRDKLGGVSIESGKRDGCLSKVVAELSCGRWLFESVNFDGLVECGRRRGRVGWCFEARSRLK